MMPGCCQGEPDRKDILLLCCQVLLYCFFFWLRLLSVSPFFSFTPFFVVLVLPSLSNFFLLSLALFCLLSFYCPGGKNILSIQRVIGLGSRRSNASFLFLSNGSELCVSVCNCADVCEVYVCICVYRQSKRCV